MENDIGVGDIICLRDWPSSMYMGEVISTSRAAIKVRWFRNNGSTSFQVNIYERNSIGLNKQSGLYFYRFSLPISKEQLIIQKIQYLQEKWRKQMREKGKSYAEI